MTTVTVTIDETDLPLVLGSLRRSNRAVVREAGEKIRVQVADKLPLRCPATFPSTACGDFSTGADELVGSEVALTGHLIEVHELNAAHAEFVAKRAIKRWGGAAPEGLVDLEG